MAKANAAIGKKDRFEIFKRDGFCCAYCGSKSSNLTQDHIIPVARGGAYSVENIVPACSACNTAKGTKEPSIIPAKRLFF
ncbi:hypothetical protein LCGC14_0757370 [marine sediment metagenome]|uniref:HNH nuclease domain-containing protein n=1 Tax=marine sediment metagenome TaxID=412755 RepID=A0A0F9Q265_9ZZZZ